MWSRRCTQCVTRDRLNLVRVAPVPLTMRSTSVVNFDSLAASGMGGCSRRLPERVSGTLLSVSADPLPRNGKKPIRDLRGNRFGKLLVVAYSHVKGTYHYWKCQCDCGGIRVVALHALTSFEYGVTHCGCSYKRRRLTKVKKCVTLKA